MNGLFEHSPALSFPFSIAGALVDTGLVSDRSCFSRCRPNLESTRALCFLSRLPSFSSRSPQSKVVSFASRNDIRPPPGCHPVECPLAVDLSRGELSKTVVAEVERRGQSVVGGRNLLNGG